MENTYFDASNDGVIPIVPGQYPAHVCGFEGREVQTKIGTQKVFNVEFKIADAVNKMEIIKHQYVEDKFKWQHGDFWNLHSTQKIRVCCQIARNNNFRVGEEE